MFRKNPIFHFFRDQNKNEERERRQIKNSAVTIFLLSQLICDQGVGFIFECMRKTI